jgi:hypothetical protein
MNESPRCTRFRRSSKQHHGNRLPETVGNPFPVRFNRLVVTAFGSTEFILTGHDQEKQAGNVRVERNVADDGGTGSV